jgi:hypothetical protein
VEGLTVTRQTRALKLALWFALFFVGRSDLIACSISVTGRQEVSDHFVVKVLNRGKPVANLNVELRKTPNHPSSPGQVVLSGATDETGSAEFVAVKSGAYTVDIKHTAFPSSTRILVRGRSRQSTHETISVEWPNVYILQVQSLSGLLNGQIKTGNPLSDQVRPVVTPLGEATLTLLKGALEDIVDSQTTSESGAFSFGSATSGLYLLHIEAPKNSEARKIGYDGYVPIEIDSSAEALGLNLSIYPPLCATLQYRNEEGVTAQ